LVGGWDGGDGSIVVVDVDVDVDSGVDARERGARARGLAVTAGSYCPVDGRSVKLSVRGGALCAH